MKTVRVQLPMELGEDEGQLTAKVANKMGVPPAALVGLRITRQSIDARRGHVRFLLAVDVDVDDAVDCGQWPLVEPAQKLLLKRGEQRLGASPVVIGAGPCGLMAALALAEHGYRPVVLERGQEVGARSRQVQRFCQTGIHDTQNNVLFGDGGAGAFSDGKLTARGQDVHAKWVLRQLVAHGADKEILYLQRPHIGTDILMTLIARIKQTILDKGGTWYNGAQVDDYYEKQGKLQGVTMQFQGERVNVPCQVALLATGHSARDTYQMLHQKGLPMAFKPFAVGLRIEHPQQMINEVQYGAFAGHEKLGAAEYALTAQAEGRGVYTFCMCPGGMVIPSISEAGHLCVNGMSYHKRDGLNANAAIVAQVSQADCGPGVLGGIDFQRHYEKLAFDMGKHYQAPVQRVKDFLNRQETTKLGSVKPSYPRGVVMKNLWDCLPQFAAKSIAGGLSKFDGMLKGFAMDDAVLTGVEMRTSAPVRVLRDESRMSPALFGLYPAGEGAGYAGGIVSAGADGLRSACAIMETYAPML